ncbi:MAG: peptidylprolyl isomerase [Oscillospiraceae bacterium]|nr:peptidylprolyl isomerase [Oscillospiraceae bacterium]
MKKYKKLAALVLAAALCISPLTGCGKERPAPPDPAQVDVEAAAVDIYQFLAGIPADTMVATVNGQDITAAELVSWVVTCCDNIASYNYYTTGVDTINWDQKTNEMTMTDFLLDEALNMAAFQTLMHIRSEDEGIALSQEEKDRIETAIQTMEQSVEAQMGMSLDKYLSMYGMTRAVYAMNGESDLMFQALAQARFGEGTEGEPTAEDIAAYWEEQGNYYVKHILLATIDLENRLPLSESEIAQQREKAEDILAQLRQAQDPLALFDTLMHEHSQDPGLLSQPDGYEFQANTTVDPAFEQAALALEHGQISDIVEGVSGFHIILRLPPKIDPAQHKEQYITQKMTELLQGWLEQSELKTTAHVDKMDARTIFERLSAYRTAIQMQQEQQSDPSASAPDASGAK